MELQTKFRPRALCLLKMSYPTPPHLGPPKQKTKESRSLFRDEHHQQNNLTNLKIYQPENINGFLLIKINLLVNHESLN